jgi:hypothetical protein
MENKNLLVIAHSDIESECVVGSDTTIELDTRRTRQTFVSIANTFTFTTVAAGRNTKAATTTDVQRPAPVCM